MNEEITQNENEQERTMCTDVCVCITADLLFLRKASREIDGKEPGRALCEPLEEPWCEPLEEPVNLQNQKQAQSRASHSNFADQSRAISGPASNVIVLLASANST